MHYQPMRPLPPPLRGAEPGSFAEKTITERLPKIGQQILTGTALPETAVSALQNLLAEIPHGLIRPLTDTHAPDADSWNAALHPYLGQDWLQPPWFVVETYFYRRIISAMDYFSTHIDPFAQQKQESLDKTAEEIRALSEQVGQAVDEGWQHDHFLTLLKVALWGNQVDLSLWNTEERPTHDAAAQDAHLLVDRQTAVLTHLTSRPQPLRVDFILDNAAFELIGDLGLVDYLLSSGRASKINLHLKMHPTFVSDATIEDVQQTIRFLRQDTDKATRQLGQRLRERVEDGRLHLTTHPFWTSLHPLWKMPEPMRHFITPSDLVISKGDANYRRALGDAHWPTTTPFSEIVSYFPAPILFLRTCKSNVIAGLQPGQPDQISQQDPNWLYNGKWGLIEFVKPAPNK